VRVSSLLLTPLAALTLWAADPTQPVVVSAASPQVGLAPDSLATVYGPNLTTQTVSAGSPPWPTSLGDMPGVTLIDSAGKSWLVPLIFVSPNQMNIYIPAGPALGPAKMEFPVTGLPPGVGAAALRIVPVTLQNVSPGIFTANGTGSGVLAATAIRTSLVADLQTSVPVFTCSAAGSCAPVPIDLGIDTPIYLSLFGTGIRGWQNIGTPLNTTVTIGNQSFPALYAGPQPTTPGLDQVNVPLSLSLRGAGLVNVSVTAAGITSNIGQIYIN
jgi:uncharacterized protein (TIGR03437 family)